MRSLFGPALQKMLDTEMEAKLGYAKNEQNDTTNSKNDYYKERNINTTYEEIPVNISRDRLIECKSDILPPYVKSMDLRIKSFRCMPQVSITIGENESAKVRANIRNDLKNRGVEDILITCADGLTGIKEAISAVYPKCEYQCCIIINATIANVPNTN